MCAVCVFYLWSKANLKRNSSNTPTRSYPKMFRLALLLSAAAVASASYNHTEKLLISSLNHTLVGKNAQVTVSCMRILVVKILTQNVWHDFSVVTFYIPPVANSLQTVVMAPESPESLFRTLPTPPSLGHQLPSLAKVRFNTMLPHFPMYLSPTLFSVRVCSYVRWLGRKPQLQHPSQLRRYQVDPRKKPSRQFVSRDQDPPPDECRWSRRQSCQHWLSCQWHRQNRCHDSRCTVARHSQGSFPDLQNGQVEGYLS